MTRRYRATTFSIAVAGALAIATSQKSLHADSMILPLGKAGSCRLPALGHGELSTQPVALAAIFVSTAL
jgi:hypothetical protein